MKPFKITALLMVIIILVNGCFGRMPREALELSNTMGEDLKALHHSYRQLIIAHFNSLRQQIDSFIETKWLPVFIKDFIERGNLVQMVQSSHPDQRETDVTEWVIAAMDAVNKKRTELIKPLDEEEKKLLEMVDNSFSLLNQANTKIYAHLKSHAKLNEPPEGSMNIYDLKGLREKIDSALATTAARTTRILEKTGNPPNQTETASTEEKTNKN